MSAPDPLAAERARLANLVGSRENAEMLFAPKVSDGDARGAACLVLRRLNLVSGTNSIYSNCQSLLDVDVSEWGARIWANTVSHLATVDSEVRNILVAHKSSLPDDENAQVTLMQKVHAAFVFFLWILASPSRLLDPKNCCVLKFIVLQDVIMLENINSIRDGTPGRWGWLDIAIAGLREIAQAFNIRRIKAVATNERVYGAFLKRGFPDSAPISGLEFHVVSMLDTSS